MNSKSPRCWSHSLQTRLISTSDHHTWAMLIVLRITVLMLHAVLGLKVKIQGPVQEERFSIRLQ